MSATTQIKRVLADIRAGRNIEAYALFLVGLTLAVLGLAELASERVVMSALLIAVSFLVFHTTRLAPGAETMQSLLKDRSSLGSFSDLLADARTLHIYAPTAVNLIVNAADIRRFVLDRGGSVRVIVQDPQSSLVAATRAQLDDSMNFDMTLSTSIDTLKRMAQSEGDLLYKLLPFSPGYSMVCINRNDTAGFLIVEFHGFQDANISDRMHVVIKRATSPLWYSYWLERYDKMWDAATAEPTVGDGP